MIHFAFIYIVFAVIIKTPMLFFFLVIFIVNSKYGIKVLLFDKTNSLHLLKCI